MNFPHEDQNPEISTQRADTLAMAGKILPGPERCLVGRRQGRAITAASAGLLIFDVGPALPALSKTAPSGYTEPEIRRTRLVAIRANFEVNAFVSTIRSVAPKTQKIVN